MTTHHSRRRLRTKAAAALAAGAVLAGSLLAGTVALAPAASAATSAEAVVDDDGALLGVARFNSGYHGAHHGTSDAGFNAFDVTDFACGDGIVIGVYYDIEGGPLRKWEASDESCTSILPFRGYNVPTMFADTELHDVKWWVYARDLDETEPQWGGEFQDDVAGSLSQDADATYFTTTTVYRDTFDKAGEELTTTITLWPTAFARLESGGDDADAMWEELQSRTPLPDSLTQDQRDSLYKQLWCHAEYAKTEDFGGPTWDLEADHPNIPWSEVSGPADVFEHRCNWGFDPYYDSSFMYPPVNPGDLEEEQSFDAAPTVGAGPDVRVDEGSAVRLDGWATDDTTVPETRWSYEPVSGVDPGATCRFDDAGDARTSVTCTDDGVYRAVLSADDGPNDASRDSALVTVANVAPRVTLSGAEDWQVFRAGDAVALDATFTDPGSNDTHTCTVAWDDGTDQESPAVPADDGTGGSCALERSFEDAGMYTIDVTVTDDDGGSDTASVMVVVVDPEAGKLNAQGALGDLRVHASVQYPNARFDTPRGVIGLRGSWPGGSGPVAVTGTSLEWLVVTPDGETVAKGSDGMTAFLLYADSADASVRAVAWPLAEGATPPEELTLDTAPGASFDVDRTRTDRLDKGHVKVLRH